MSEFKQLGLSQPILTAIEEMGFETPTPIQQQSIPTLLEGNRDFVGLAQTGTGKTAAFGLPLLDLIDTEIRHPQGLILAPTRELCVQITKELELFGKNTSVRTLAVYGGADISRQIRALKRGIHVVVATPGRLRDLLRRKAVNISDINFVVLDEADEMLNMGFKEELDDILQNTPEEKNTWLFSATMPKEVRQIASDYMTKPLEVSVGEKNSVNSDIDHQYVIARKSDRYDVLRRFLDYSPDMYGLVFCRTRLDCRDLAEQLTQDGYNADALHGDLNQSQRDRVMSRFRNKSLQVLVATDVAARGIDVSDISHVFHFNIPDDRSFYTHRSGRTGRAGSKGISLVLLHPKDDRILKEMSRRLRIDFTHVQIPTGKAICEQRLMHYIKEVKETPVKEEISPFLPNIISELEDLTKSELIERMAAMSFNSLLDTYKNAPDLNVHNGSRRKKKSSGKYARLFINLGGMDLNGKGELINILCTQGRISGDSIGRIEFQRKHSFFDLDEAQVAEFLRYFKDFQFNGRTIRVNSDSQQRSGGGDGKRKDRKKRSRSRDNNRKYAKRR